MTVTVDQIATTLLRTAPEAGSIDHAAWTMWIEDARRQIKNRLGELALLDQDNLDFVVREAVALKVKRPDAAKSVAVTVDDSSVSKTYESGAGQVAILPDWWELLTPALDERTAFTINPIRRRC